MEHLRELFHTALNDEGIVEIAGFVFQRDQANIFPIWHPEDEHDESIEALFLRLLEEES